jgi:hypothetical protein
MDGYDYFLFLLRLPFFLDVFLFVFLVFALIWQCLILISGSPLYLIFVPFDTGPHPFGFVRDNLPRKL